MFRCPACPGALKMLEYRGIRLDECADCHGRWFDFGEFRKAKDRTDEDLRWIDFDAFDRRAGTFEVTASGRMCPNCRVLMHSMTYQHSGVVIDRCDTCEGIWLDHGEFENIVAYLNDIVKGKSSPELAKDAFRQFVEIGTGPESIPSEIRDFLVVLTLLQQRMAVEHPRVAKAVETLYRVWPFK